MRSTRILEVRPEIGESATGKVLVKDGKVTIIGDTAGGSSTKGEILAITAGVPKERNFWTGEVSGSANYQSGNTDKKDLQWQDHCETAHRRTTNGFRIHR